LEAGVASLAFSMNAQIAGGTAQGVGFVGLVPNIKIV
jgi:hypothetical protein